LPVLLGRFSGFLGREPLFSLSNAKPGGFTKSLEVLWLDHTLFGEKLGFERDFLFFHCQFSWSAFLASRAMSPPFLRAMPSLFGGPSAWCGGSWLGCLDLPAMGAVSI